MTTGDHEIDLDTAYDRLRTLRSSVGHRPWQPGMPMEQALDALGASLRELKRAEGDIDRLRREVRALRNERDAAEHNRRELEERVTAAQKLEAVGRLAGSIAHDFNNLILIITGRAELLLERMGERDPERKHAREIRRAGARASTLARQLLAFSRPRREEPAALDSFAAIASSREMLEIVTGNVVAVELRLDPGAGAIEVDQAQLEQVILNLAMNARDAMPSGGKLSIATRPEVLRKTAVAKTSDAEAGAYVVIAVTDTGAGMDEATRARIFEPYFTTKQARQGTGLGLASVLSIVREHRGFIEVESEPGVGSRFEIYLPRADSRGDREADASRPGPAYRNRPPRSP